MTNPTAGPITRAGALASLVVALSFVFVVALRSSQAEGRAFTIALAVALTVPLWLLASTLAAIVSVDDVGVRRRGLLGAAQLPWEAVSRVSCHRGLYGFRHTVVHGGRRRITLSSAMASYGDVARAVLEQADARGIEVRGRPQA